MKRIDIVTALLAGWCASSDKAPTTDRAIVESFGFLADAVIDDDNQYQKRMAQEMMGG